jgi:hypothetical protein
VRRQRATIEKAVRNSGDVFTDRPAPRYNIVYVITVLSQLRQKLNLLRRRNQAEQRNGMSAGDVFNEIKIMDSHTAVGRIGQSECDE